MFSDPLEWNAIHIRSWLNWSTKKFSLTPSPDPEKFPKTGEELCEFSRADFEKCAGNARSGKLLAKHIAHLKHSVTGRASSPLNTDCKIDEEEEKGKAIIQGKKSIVIDVSLWWERMVLPITNFSTRILGMH